MLRRFLRSKIHKAHVTHADLEYEGSISIPPELLKSSKILPNEAVEIWNVTNGNRLETYAIEGLSGSKDICINGAAAHLCRPGDVIIIACFSYLTEVDIITHKPTVVFVDSNNKIKQITEEIPGPQKR